MISFQALNAHSLYTSFTQIDWNKDDGSVELVMQLHSHELETKLSLLVDERLSFLEDADFPKLLDAAAPFIKNNTKIAVDGTVLDLTFIGMEVQYQTVLIYLEADWPKAPYHIQFMNSLFLGDLPGQINSVLAVVGGERRGADITHATGPAIFEF
jgi:hypothetical protein